VTVAVFPICIEVDTIVIVAVDSAALYVSQVLYTGPMFQVPALPFISARSSHGVLLTRPSRLFAAVQRNSAAIPRRRVFAVRGGRKQVHRSRIQFETYRTYSYNTRNLSRKYPVPNLIAFQLCSSKQSVGDRRAAVIEIY
jgi:hypothetical protein